MLVHLRDQLVPPRRQFQLAPCRGPCRLTTTGVFHRLMKGLVVKVVIISGTGLIGSKLVNKLRRHGHHAVPASPDTGVNTLTGEGLADAFRDAAVVVDVSTFLSSKTPPLWSSSRHQLATSWRQKQRPASDITWRCPSWEPTASSRAPISARIGQEKLITTSAIPHSIVRTTQMFEVFESIADTATEGDTVRLAVLVQPMAAETSRAPYAGSRSAGRAMASSRSPGPCGSVSTISSDES